jgi:hypothetical protein
LSTLIRPICRRIARRTLGSRVDRLLRLSPFLWLGILRRGTLIGDGFSLWSADLGRDFLLRRRRVGLGGSRRRLRWIFLREVFLNDSGSLHRFWWIRIHFHRSLSRGRWI